MFVQANPRKLKLKRVGEYVDGVKFYLQISEEISFISENMIFNDAVISFSSKGINFRTNFRLYKVSNTQKCSLFGVFLWC